MVEKSGEFAQRLLLASDDEKERVKIAFQLALSRAPTSTEVDQAINFIEDAARSLGKQEMDENTELRAWAVFCQALFVSNEFRHVQ